MARSLIPVTRKIHNHKRVFLALVELLSGTLIRTIPPHFTFEGFYIYTHPRTYTHTQSLGIIFLALWFSCNVIIINPSALIPLLLFLLHLL